MTVLVINSGSSSIKYQLIDTKTTEVIASGLVERIGTAKGRIKHVYKGETHRFEEPIAEHGEGLRRVIQIFNEIGPNLQETNIKAVGHRVVQGGRYFDKAVIIDDAVAQKIEELAPLAPLHNPAHLRGIEVTREVCDAPNVAVFDTAFFQTLPNAAATYALNREVAEKYAIRRYGAHGTSHQFVSKQVIERLGRDDLKQIILHLGNGASISAVDSGIAVDTSMGLTPLQGLMMGSRTGDIDPAAVFHLYRNAGMSIDEIDDLFNKKSGMLGLVGENDMREVWALVKEGNEDAIEAVQVYVHRIVQYIGAYWAILGGLDVITFTAGIGERDHLVRAHVLDRLAPFGVKYNAELNAVKVKEPLEISAPDSSVKVLVIPTNEELCIAQQAMELVTGSPTGEPEA